jgi:hypothetical protein
MPKVWLATGSASGLGAIISQEQCSHQAIALYISYISRLINAPSAQELTQSGQSQRHSSTSLVRYNGLRAAIINGAAKIGYSSDQSLTAMERISGQLPAG